MLTGQFFFSTAKSLGLRVEALLRNTVLPGKSETSSLHERLLNVDLRVFRDGERIYEEQHFATIPFDGIQEISATTLPILQDQSEDCLIQVRCSLPSGEEGEPDVYLAQSHQLNYINDANGLRSSLLYQQLPLHGMIKGKSPIVLLAPKVWISSNFNSYVVFCNSLGDRETEAHAEPLSVSVLTESGHVVHSQSVALKTNSVWTLDVRSALDGKVPLEKTPTFLNVVARGGSSLFAIKTFLRNEISGNLALEHSLSPHYYVSGQRERVREEALLLPAV